MATPAEPTATTEPAGALFRALRSAGVEADLAYRADDEVRAQAGQNVIASIGAQITELRAEMKAEMKAGFAGVNARIDAQTALIDAQTSRIDVLQRVIWPLIAILATSVFGLLYKAVTG